MWTSTDDCFCHEHVRHRRSPNSAWAQRTSSSAGSASSSTASNVRWLLTEQDLLQGVAAQPEAQRLERDHLVGRDVAEVHVGAELLHEPRLARLRRRLEDQV